MPRRHSRLGDQMVEVPLVKESVGWIGEWMVRAAEAGVSRMTKKHSRESLLRCKSNVTESRLACVEQKDACWNSLTVHGSVDFEPKEKRRRTTLRASRFVLCALCLATVTPMCAIWLQPQLSLHFYAARLSGSSRVYFRRDSRGFASRECWWWESECHSRQLCLGLAPRPATSPDRFCLSADAAKQRRQTATCLSSIMTGSTTKIELYARAPNSQHDSVSQREDVMNASMWLARIVRDS